MLATIDTLRDISRRCLADETLSAEQSHWLGATLESFLDHRRTSIDDAMGLKFPQGGVPWWREEAIRKRNAALRELAQRYLGDLGPSARARQVWTMATRYGASAWRHDQDKDDLPLRYRGTPKEFIWRAFASGAAMPVCQRQLRTILG